MKSFDWQLLVVLACVGWAAAIVLRRALRLFGKAPSHGCGTSACSACPSNRAERSAATREGFVSLQSLVQSSRSGRASDDSR